MTRATCSIDFACCDRLSLPLPLAQIRDWQRPARKKLRELPRHSSGLITRLVGRGRWSNLLDDSVLGCANSNDSKRMKSF
jgi:hypothetical protein